MRLSVQEATLGNISAEYPHRQVFVAPSLGWEFAGRYQQSWIDTSSIIEIRTDGMFIADAFWARGIRHQAVGNVREEEGWLVLEVDPRQEHISWLKSRYWPVVVEGDAFLLSDLDIERMCNAVNSGWEPSNSPRRFLKRTQGEMRSDPGPPLLPEADRGKLLSEPVVATLVAVRNPGHPSAGANTRVEFVCDKGEVQGLWPGMEIYASEPLCPWFFRGGRITSVECERAEGYLSWHSAANPQPEPGWKITTRKPVLAR